MQGTDFIPRVTSSGVKATLFRDGFHFFSLSISKEKKIRTALHYGLFLEF